MNDVQDLAKLQRKRIRSVKIWGGLVLALVGIGYGAVWLTKDVVLPGGAGAPLVVAVGPQDHARGPEDAPLTLVEYSDFQCPACRAFVPLLEKLQEDPELIGKIRFVYRHFPLSSIHQHAQRAAQFAEAAGRQGKFWEFHDELFNGQASWEALSRAAAEEVFLGYARSLSLDMNRFVADASSSDVAKSVNDSFSGGVSGGINSTPTFFLNGKRMVHPTGYEQFKKLLLDALPTVSQTP